MGNYWSKFDNGATLNGEKGNLSDLVDGKNHRITNVKFFETKYGDSCAFSVGDIDDAFFYGNSPITTMLQEIREDGMLDELNSIDVKFLQKHSDRYNSDYVVMAIG